LKISRAWPEQLPGTGPPMSLLCAIEPQKAEQLLGDEDRRDHRDVRRVRAAAVIGMVDDEGVALAMSSPNASMTAAVQAETRRYAAAAPRAAPHLALAFISAQEASCDSRTMVEKPVRNSEFCISCTMPERLAFTTSSSTRRCHWLPLS
jgi:hypothetical protein